MISMRSLANIFGGPERSALDLPVAGLAALAVAFAAFTIPDALLGRAVEATGLPAVVSMAQPPLGATARSLLALSGALAAFAVTFALLRWLDRFASRAPARVPDEVAPTPAVPRIRKADAHPDAPPCRPISATRDLGEPAPPSRTAVPVADVSRTAVPVPDVAEAASAAVVRPPPAVTPSASLTDLMARLERGLAKREGAEPVSSSRPDQAPPAPSNDRLQSAIEGLRALSARA